MGVPGDGADKRGRGSGERAAGRGGEVRSGEESWAGRPSCHHGVVRAGGGPAGVRARWRRRRRRWGAAERQRAHVEARPRHAHLSLRAYRPMRMRAPGHALPRRRPTSLVRENLATWSSAVSALSGSADPPHTFCPAAHRHGHILTSRVDRRRDGPALPPRLWLQSAPTPLNGVQALRDAVTKSADGVPRVCAPLGSPIASREDRSLPFDIQRAPWVFVRGAVCSKLRHQQTRRVRRRPTMHHGPLVTKQTACKRIKGGLSGQMMSFGLRKQISDLRPNPRARSVACVGDAHRDATRQSSPFPPGFYLYSQPPSSPEMPLPLPP